MRKFEKSSDLSKKQVREVGLVRKSKMSLPGTFERIGQFFFENLIWSARLLFFSPFFFKLSVWGAHFPVCLKNLNKTVFLEFTQSFFFKIYACFCVKFTNFQTLKLYITIIFFKRTTVPGNYKTYQPERLINVNQHTKFQVYAI